MIPSPNSAASRWITIGVLALELGDLLLRRVHLLGGRVRRPRRPGRRAWSCRGPCGRPCRGRAAPACRCRSRSPVFSSVFAKTIIFDPALEVVERREHHVRAAAGADLLVSLGDDAADRDPSAVRLARRARSASSRCERATPRAPPRAGGR